MKSLQYIFIGLMMFGQSCDQKKKVVKETTNEEMVIKKKEVVYQVFTRLFGNTNTTNKPWGTIEELYHVWYFK